MNQRSDRLLHSLTNEELVRRSRIGQAHERDLALNELMSRQRQELLAISRRMVRSFAEDPEDLTQEACLSLYRSLSRFSPDRGHLGPWSRTILRRRLVDFHRKSVPTPMVLVENLHAHLTVEEPGTLAIDAKQLVKEGLSCLGKTERAAVELRHLEGLGYPEIADRLDITAASVKTILNRALRKMEVHLTR
jgi:RNA polymerase sigma factor (sigma-70 family)